MISPLAMCCSVLVTSNLTKGDDKVLSSEFKSVGSRPKQVRRKEEMTPTLAAKSLIRTAWPLRRHGKLENIVHHVVRFMAGRLTKDFTPRRARAIWEGAARRIDSEEMDALREALIEEQKREQRELRVRLAELDKALASSDPSFFGASVEEEGAEVRG